VSKAARGRILAATGKTCDVECAVLASGKCPAKEFLVNDCELIREGGKDKPLATARARFLSLFQQMADTGSVSPKRLKSEMSGLFAFRHEVANQQIRFPCFRDGKNWVLTHGFVKPGAQSGLGDWPESEVARAKEIRSEYLSLKVKQAD